MPRKLKTDSLTGPRLTDFLVDFDIGFLIGFVVGWLVVDFLVDLPADFPNDLLSDLYVGFQNPFPIRSLSGSAHCLTTELPLVQENQYTTDYAIE